MQKLGVRERLLNLRTDFQTFGHLSFKIMRPRYSPCSQDSGGTQEFFLIKERERERCGLTQSQPMDYSVSP